MQFSMFTALQWLNLLISSYFSCRLFLSLFFWPCLSAYGVIYLCGWCNSKQGRSSHFSSLFKFNLTDLNLCDTAIILSLSDLTGTSHFFFFLPLKKREKWKKTNLSKKIMMAVALMILGTSPCNESGAKTERVCFPSLYIAARLTPHAQAAPPQ